MGLSGGTDHLDWVGLTEGEVRNILSMPDKAQREVSKSVSLCAENRFVQRVRNPHLGGSEQRYRNWLAERGHQQAWVQAVPWQHEGYLSLTNAVYQANVSRHYRLPRPDLA